MGPLRCHDMSWLVLHQSNCEDEHYKYILELMTARMKTIYKMLQKVVFYDQLTNQLPILYGDQSHR